MADDAVLPGGTITLEADYITGDTQDLVDPEDPRIDILDPLELEVVANAIPYRLGLGHYAYDFVAPLDAPAGAWTARWTGSIDNFPAGPIDDFFYVLAPGSVPVPGGGTSGVCASWATTNDVITIGEDPASVSSLGVWLKVASDILYQLSGLRWAGVCTDDGVRPCRQRDCACPSALLCGCGWLSEVELEHPVVSIIAVKLDGDVLDPLTDYRVDNRRLLVRLPDPITGAARAWPCCQRIDLADTEVGTLSVAYTFGEPPVDAGRYAAAELGFEFARAHTEGAGECKLPQRVTAITRKGVSMAFAVDSMDFLASGRTGLFNVDLFLAAYGRAAGAARPMRTVSPDTWPKLRHTGT